MRVSSTGVPAGVDRQLVTENVAGISREIEIAVLRQVDRRCLVARRAVVNRQLVLVRERIANTCLQGPRISFFSIGTGSGQGHADSVRRVARHRVPDDFVKTFDSAVQVIRAVVGRERVRPAVQRELPLGNPIPYRPTIAPK